MATNVATYGIGKPGGMTATMGYGSIVLFTPTLPSRACRLIGTDPSAKRLVGTDASVQRLIGTDPSPKRLTGPRECS